MLALLMLAGAPQAALSLTCGGGGTARRPTSSTAYGFDNSGNTATATVNGFRSEGFEDQVDVRIEGEDSRIRMPRSMLPPIHGGKQGWMKLRNVELASDAITGTVAVNALNRPKVYIDRRTGVISINGKSGHYTGQCEAVEAEQPRRF